MAVDYRRRIAYVLLTAAAIAAALALWAYLTGGFRVYVFGVGISVRGEHRALFVALVLALLGVAVLDGSRKLFQGLTQPTIPAVIAAFTALVMLCVGVSLGSRAAGGSDSYGYVSQAALWMKGDLRVRQEFMASVPWPDAEWTFTPLGYRPADRHSLVPTYPPGLPLLMALFNLLVGSCGPYLVAPLCGAALVALTYALGARLSNPIVGLMAALCIASSPTVLVMTLSAMSDVPVAAFWAAALLLACGQARWTVVACGMMTGIAILIRPNLAPLAVIPAAIGAFARADAGARNVCTRLALFAVACAPFVGFVAWLFSELYGSPFESGYGVASAIYSRENLSANLARYPRWLLETQGPVVYLFALSPIAAVAGARGEWRVRLLLVAFVAGVSAAYLFYLPFDVWWFLRFLLPAFPVLFVLALDAAWTGARGWGVRVQATVVLLLGLVMVYKGATESHTRQSLSVGGGEQKFVEAGLFIRDHLPENAVVLAHHHSGSVRHYSGRLTLRYDILEPDWLDRALAFLIAQGRPPYFLLDSAEVELFRERFGGEAAARLLDRPPIAVTDRGDVLLFAGSDGSPRQAPAAMLRTGGCAPAATSRWAVR